MSLSAGQTILPVAQGATCEGERLQQEQTQFTCGGLRGQARWKLGYTAAEFRTILAPKQLREQFDSLARYLQGAPRD